MYMQHAYRQTTCKPGLVLLYGSYSCSRAHTIIFIIRCTALLSNRRLSGPTMRLFVDISWTFPKSSLFTEERSCWFPETTRSYVNNNKLHQTTRQNSVIYFCFKSCDRSLTIHKIQQCKLNTLIYYDCLNIFFKQRLFLSDAEQTGQVFASTADTV